MPCIEILYVKWFLMQKMRKCVHQNQQGKIKDELLEKLKLDEEKEKKKMEKEAKRREELEKMKNESFVRQANLVPVKKEKKVQPKKYAINYQINSNLKTASSYNKKQSTNERRYHRDSSSSENSGKRYGENCWSSSNCSSVPDSMWNNKNEHFPVLGAEAPVPVVNVWEERKYKQEEIQALQPQNKYDEEAMLQEALALSLMEATREEEQKRKLDEEYKLQMELLEHNPKVLDNFQELDGFRVTSKSEVESVNVLESAEEKPHTKNFPRNAAISSIIQKSKTSSSSGARPKINKIIDSFGGWGLKDNYEENSNSLSNFENGIGEKTSKKAWKHENHLPGFQQKSVTTNPQKPENVNNWKMPDTEIIKPIVSDSWSNDFSNDIKKSSASDPWENEVSNFENDIGEKTSKKAWKHENHLPGFQQKSVTTNPQKPENVNNWKMPDTEITKPIVSDSWSNDFSNDIKKSSASDPWENEVLSDEKEVAFDGNKVSFSHLNSATVGFDTFSKEKEYLNDKRSDNMSGKGHNSLAESAKPSSQWDDVSPDDKATSTITKNMNSVGYLGSLSTNDTKTNCDNTKGSFSNFETAKLARKDKPDKNSSKKRDSLDVFTKSSMAKGTSVDSYKIKKEKELSNGNSFSQFEKTYDYVLGDTAKSKNAYAPTETFLSSDNIWSDKSPNKSTASDSDFPNQNMLQTELPGEEIPSKFGTVEESTLETLMSDKEIDTPPIFPPHPVPAGLKANVLEQAITAEISGDKYTTELPPILPPQASPQVPSPYLLNPGMFPVVNPMLGLGMDPITMRQMLMLSNPFFASQLLAMEQYYRSLGMPVDLFSFPTQPVPNMLFPGLANTSEQNTFPNPADMNMLSTHNFVQSHYQDQSVLSSKNTDGVSPEEHLTKCPSGFDKNVTVNVPDTEENPWYASLLSNDNESAIPPPKPLNVDNQISSTSLLSDTAGSTSNFVNNINSKDYLCTNLSSDLPDVESHKSITAVEASMPKTEASGWGDLDDERFHNSKPKTISCDDDYGWGAESLPAKSLKSPSKYEDKKVVHRQPARQPQLSRFQGNRRFN